MGATVTSGGGFFDAQCPHCGHRYGWSGRADAGPPCPKCGFRRPAVVGDVAEIEAFRQFLRDRKAAREAAARAADADTAD